MTDEPLKEYQVVMPTGFEYTIRAHDVDIKEGILQFFLYDEEGVIISCIAMFKEWSNLYEIRKKE